MCSMNEYGPAVCFTLLWIELYMGYGMSPISSPGEKRRKMASNIGDGRVESSTKVAG